MARYRRIDPYIWHDERFTDFSDDSKLLFFHLLTSPRGNPLGCFVQGKSDMAEYLKWPMKRLTEPFRILLSSHRIEYHEKSRLLLILNYLKYNPLENENQAKMATKYLSELPCHIQFFQYLKQYLEQYNKDYLKPLLDSLTNRIGNGMANTEPYSLALSLNRNTEETNTSPPPQAAAGAIPPPGSENHWGTPEDLIALYNQTTPDEFPSVETLSEARCKKAKQYLAQFPDRDFWVQVFTQCRASPFLRGLRPGKSHEKFRGSLDWLLSKGEKDGIENCVKVYEGKYGET